MVDWAAIRLVLADQDVTVPGQDLAPRPVRGGDINAAWRIDAGGGHMFLKTAPLASQEMFEAEAEGLRELARADAVRVPAVYACGPAGRDAFIAIEWLEFGPPSKEAEIALGEQLAAMHRYTAGCFGWHRDNTIGHTPQLNAWSDDWPGFFRERRLQFQLELAAQNGHTGELQALGRRLADGLDALFDGYTPEASLLHGDLWGGNWAVADGEPVIFDPAVYYGDRESDIAMTKLFGGFGRDFHAAYEAAWPLAEGNEARQDLYQLYHLLNHLNLFGGGYLGSALDKLGRLCARI